MVAYNINVSQTLLLLLSITQALGVTLDDGVCGYRKLERTGDVKFLVVAGYHESRDDGMCSNELSKSTHDNMAALNLIFDILNGVNANNVTFLPRTTIGYDLYDNCDNVDMTTDLLFSGHVIGHDMTCSGSTNQTTEYVGVLSLTTPEATKVISKYTHPLPLLRPMTSSPSLQSRDFPNLLQTVTSFHQEAMAITKMLKYIGWNYVALIYSETFREEAMLFKSLAHAQDICFKYVGLPTDESITKLHLALNDAYGKSVAVVYFGSSSSVIEFINREKISNRPYSSSIHWVFASKQTSNTRIEKRAIDTITFVQYLDHTIPELNQQMIINPHHMIDAIMVGVSAIKQTWESVCPATSGINTCPGFTTAVDRGQLLNNVKSGVNVADIFGAEYLPYQEYNPVIRFEVNGTQEHNTIQLRHRKLQSLESLIGTYTIGGDFNLLASVSSLPTSAAGLDSHECLEQIDLRYSYLHGDVLILGLFTVRNAGSSPFKCGLTRRGVNDIITVSSFFQSVISRRRSSDKYKLGAIAIDDCYNGINTNEYLTALFSKKRFINDPLTNNPINFDNVIVIIGALSSPVTLLVADLATSINIPMLSYSASSPDLDNKNRYPHFLRSVPSDSLQVQGMIEILVNLKISHVGLLYIDDAYGKAGKIRLEEEAMRFNICVKTPIPLTQNMTDNYVKTKVVGELYNQQVRVVLYFGLDTIAKQILDVMDSSKEPFVFIASEAWGTNKNLIADSAGQKSKGSIVFNIDTKSNENTNYKEYLQTLHANQVDQNRWIPSFFDDYNGCYSVSSFEKPDSQDLKVCGTDYNNSLSAKRIENLYKDQRTVHTINSVYAATESIRTVCANCTAAVIKKNIIRYFEAMKSTFYEKTSSRMFDEDGNGNIGYAIFNIQMNTTTSEDGKKVFSAEYKEIGHYTKSGKLDLKEKPKFYDVFHNEVPLAGDKIHCSAFQHQAICSKICPPVTTTTETTPVTMSMTTSPPNTDGTWKTVAIAFIFGFSIVVLVLLVVLVRPCVMKQVSSEKGDSLGTRTRSVSGSHSVYDEPGTLRRRGGFDNLVFMPDSASLRSQPTNSGTLKSKTGSQASLDQYTPTQYSQIRQMSNPEILFNHVRQVSNQELRSYAFDSLERPMSTLSAPAYKPYPNNSPASKRMQQHHGVRSKVGKQTYSPKTPHSAPTREKPQTVVYRPRTQSSPRFRYPSNATDDSHYTMPRIDSQDDSMSSKRKYGVSDENIHRHHDDVSNDVSDDSAGNEPYLHFENDNPGIENEPKLNYISAKDLVNNDNDEEESAEADVDQEDKTVLYTDTAFLQTAPPSSATSTQPPKGRALNDSDGGGTQTHSAANNDHQMLTSPSDTEVMNINFPPSDSPKGHHPVQVQSKAPSMVPITETVPVNQNRDYNRNTSITDVPDVIKHGLFEEDGVFII